MTDSREVASAVNNGQEQWSGISICFENEQIKDDKRIFLRAVEFSLFFFLSCHPTFMYK